ncbi:MAG: amidohydrolase [Phycisphaerales bacterium]|nr:amidohydrolase [Phycisphaerales bacterium]
MHNDPPRPWNRTRLDYRAEAARLGSPVAPIIDVHTHVNGPDAAGVFAEVMSLFGIEEVWTMTDLETVEPVQQALEGRLQLIAVPDFSDEDRTHAYGPGYMDRLHRYREHGCRIAKFWAAPRSLDYGEAVGDPTLMRLDNPDRIEIMQLATELGMGLMAHIADPDTWFKTAYADQARYGTKLEQYEPLEQALARFDVPWIAAHMGGWPEDLEFLDGLLARHPNLHLDTSATKWMVRELSRHSRDDLIDFLQRHSGRILFGSDNVTRNAHLAPPEDPANTTDPTSPTEAFELYASRYYALRSLWESEHRGPSPIVDPDLHRLDPDRHGPMDAPDLDGKSIPADQLRVLYHDAPRAFLARVSALSASR